MCVNVRPQLAKGALAAIICCRPPWRSPEGGVASFYRSFRPDLVAAAQTLPALESGATLTDAFAALNPVALSPKGAATFRRVPVTRTGTRVVP